MNRLKYKKLVFEKVSKNKKLLFNSKNILHLKLHSMQEELEIYSTSPKLNLQT